MEGNFKSVKYAPKVKNDKEPKTTEDNSLAPRAHGDTDVESTAVGTTETPEEEEAEEVPQMSLAMCLGLLVTVTVVSQCNYL